MSDAGEDPIFTRTWKRVEAARRELLESTRRRIAERLLPVCDHMSEAQFADFVTRVAQLEIKYSMRRAAALMRPTVTSDRSRHAPIEPRDAPIEHRICRSSTVYKEES